MPAPRGTPATPVMPAKVGISRFGPRHPPRVDPSLRWGDETALTSVIPDLIRDPEPRATPPETLDPDVRQDDAELTGAVRHNRAPDHPEQATALWIVPYFPRPRRIIVGRLQPSDGEPKCD